MLLIIFPQSRTWKQCPRVRRTGHVALGSHLVVTPVPRTVRWLGKQYLLYLLPQIVLMVKLEQLCEGSL